MALLVLAFVGFKCPARCPRSHGNPCI